MNTVLSIGNSFSQDAQHYLHKLSVAAKEPINCINLYIGGCSLEMHNQNLETAAKAYVLECNGISTGIMVSLQDVLEHAQFSVVTLQQASHLSGDYTTYQPYLNRLAKYVCTHQPNAKLYIHQTWAYASNSQPLMNRFGLTDANIMYEKVIASYEKAAKELAVALIPSGQAMMNAFCNGIGVPLHRDGFHASRSYGRYILAATWFMKLTEKHLDGIYLPFFDDGTVIKKDIYDIATKAATDAVFS